VIYYNEWLPVITTEAVRTEYPCAARHRHQTSELLFSALAHYLISMKKKPLHKPPKGFLFSTAEAAIKKPGRKDMALIYSEVEADMAAVFTTNAIKAAPVRICIERLKGGSGQAIVVNSGNANACTGDQGIKDARLITSEVAAGLGIDRSLVYPSSTGVIGQPLPMERVLPALSRLSGNAGTSSLEDAALAIMTTDTFPKSVRRQLRVGGKTGTICGICKGAGMIAPNMATMLCFLLTDVSVEQKTLQTVLSDAVNKSFNRITIDGDMSTNDTVLMMANGMAGNRPLGRRSADLRPFREAVSRVCNDLARLVVQDGEGATKLIEVVVTGARTEQHAEKAAFSIANSSLVKTAVYGNDANWGRVLCAVGYAGIPMKEEKTDIYFNKIKVVKNGQANGKEAEATEALKSREVRIAVDLNMGGHEATVLTCDLTEEYVKINAEYRT
jgi:glutamate N-acetyltransferase/amino-acid N-acetyltransferase